MRRSIFQRPVWRVATEHINSFDFGIDRPDPPVEGLQCRVFFVFPMARESSRCLQSAKILHFFITRSCDLENRRLYFMFFVFHSALFSLQLLDGSYGRTGFFSLLQTRVLASVLVREVGAALPKLAGGVVSHTSTCNFLPRTPCRYSE